MPTAILHIQSAADLPATAAQVFHTLGIADATERESDNYPGGSYFMGTAGAIEIKVALESDDGWEDHQYWVVASVPTSAGLAMDDLLPALVLELLQAGLPVAREVGLTADGGSILREDYRLDQAGELQVTRAQRLLGERQSET